MLFLVLTSLRNYILKIQHQHVFTKSVTVGCFFDNPNNFFVKTQQTQLTVKFVLWAPQTVVH